MQSPARHVIKWSSSTHANSMDFKTGSSQTLLANREEVVTHYHYTAGTHKASVGLPFDTSHSLDKFVSCLQVSIVYSVNSTMAEQVSMAQFEVGTSIYAVCLNWLQAYHRSYAADSCLSLPFPSQDFNLKERRHYVHSGPQGGSLGDGMVPQNEERVAPVSLHRSRAAHDTTGAEPGTSTSGHGQQAPTPGSSSGWASSYQLQCQGLDPLSAKKKTGKKILAVPGESESKLEQHCALVLPAGPK